MNNVIIKKEEKKMKKIFLLLVLSFACLFVLAGCEGFVIPGVIPATPQ